MQLTIAVHGSPYAGKSNEHALAFCAAAIRGGHHIGRVFFYHDGVYAALGSRVAPQDEFDCTPAWRAFAAASGAELCVCIANGLKRGVVDAVEAARHELAAGTVADGFVIVGLGQLVDAIAASDRYVEFPA